MALDTLDIKRPVLLASSLGVCSYGYPRVGWTEIEDALLIEEWSKWLGPTGQARRGFLAHIALLLNKRSKPAIRHRMKRLVAWGTVPKQWERAEFSPVYLASTDAAWLAGILDGEGHICLSAVEAKRKVLLCLCTNTNMDVLAKVEQLVPFVHRTPCSRPKLDNRGIRSNLPCYQMLIQNVPAINNVLPQLLPYICHSEKKRRALAMIAFVQGRIENGT